MNKFLDKSVKGKVKFKEILDIKLEDNKPLILVKNKKYFIYPLVQRDPIFDIDDNIKGKIIIGIMINFETLFNNMLRHIMPKRTELFFGEKDKDKEKEQGGSVSYTEILNNPTKDFKQYVIDKQVEKLSYDVIESIEKLVNKLKLKDFYFKDNEKLVKEFYELYYRRNVIIHNAGKVNQLYLMKTGKTEEDIAIGTQLENSDKYIKHAIDVCNNFGYLIYSMFGKTLDAEDKEEYFYHLGEYGLALSTKGKWEDSKFIFELLLKFDNRSSAQSYEYRFDLLNCKKHLGDKSYIKETNEMDVSALNGLYKICKELLLDNSQKVLEMLNFYYPKEISNGQIENLPIFADFRGSKEYEEFVKKHNGEFSYYEIEEA